MDRDQVQRRFFAELTAAKAGIREGPLLEAFAATPRELFVGPGPWKLATSIGYLETPSDDLSFLYRDYAVAIAPARKINNGQPSLHAVCLAALDPHPGETATHVGAGTGYYTAILARLVGPDGLVAAYETEEDLAQRCRLNLTNLPNVSVLCQSGVEGPLPQSDVIYVSAGATAPAAIWLDALKSGGRLLFPLTPDEGTGAMLLVTRPRDPSDRERFHARFVCGAMFIPCTGARDEESARRLAEAFRSGIPRDVHFLIRSSSPDETCVLAGDNWWLSSRGLEQI